MVHYFEPPIETGIFLGTLDARLKSLKRKKPVKRHGSPDEDDDEDDNSDDDHEVSWRAEDDVDNAIHEQADASSKGGPALESSSASTRLKTPQQNLKHQHFNVLNTILHKCLQEHDYERARRAFAMLLRFNIDSQEIDLRKKGLWGFGAEILLHTSSNAWARGSTIVAKEDFSNRSNSDTDPFSYGNLTHEGFEAARQYLDRLILQYPYKKNRPSDVSSKQLLPVMIGLRILQIQAESQRYLEVSESTERAGTSDSDDGPTSESSIDAVDSGAKKRQAKLKELRQAEEIKTSLEELIVSPPYDRDAQLWRLLGGVGEWMRDLAMASSDGEPKDILEANVYLEQATAAFRKANELRIRPSPRGIIPDETS